MEVINAIWLSKGRPYTSLFGIKIFLISSKGKIEQSQNIMSCVNNFLMGAGWEEQDELFC